MPMPQPQISSRPSGRVRKHGAGAEPPDGHAKFYKVHEGGYMFDNPEILEHVSRAGISPARFKPRKEEA